jgi:hypothetical protein
VEEPRKQVDRWKARCYRLFSLLHACPEVRDRLAAEAARIAEELK